MLLLGIVHKAGKQVVDHIGHGGPLVPVQCIKAHCQPDQTGDQGVRLYPEWAVCLIQTADKVVKYPEMMQSVIVFQKAVYV